jgi:hypothetical protein
MLRDLARIGLAVAVAGGLAVLTTAPLHAGGNLESIDVTAGTPSPIPGHIIGKVIPIKWDTRCMPVRFRVNNTQDPIPNPLGAPFVTVAAATPVLQQSLDAWNQIPTSFIDMRIVGTVANPGFSGFDMVNELTFRAPSGFGAIAVSPSVNFIEDVTLANGDDIDGDGDSDVSSAITSCSDVDHDGDIEFPAGNYKAGTILENDIIFNTNASDGYRFTLTAAEVDTNPRSVDLKTIAVHESGHSHGLSHAVLNQVSDSDGGGATMFPFVNTAEPASELAQATLDEDDIAWSSYFYPEGTAFTGPAALQPGDLPFNLVYGLIKGSVTHGVLNQPVAGAVVSASGVVGSHKVFSTTYSGTTQVSVDPATGNSFAVSPAFDIVDGNYVLPVKIGLWNIGIEAVDGLPVSAGSINTTVILGSIFGQQNFNEEFWNGPGEGALEVRSGLAVPQLAIPLLPNTGVNLVTNNEINIANFGNLNFVGFTGVAPGFYYAVRVPTSQITAAAAGGNILFHAMQFHTIAFDPSVVPVFAEATLTTGTVSGTTATLDLAHPLARETNFVGQDNDFAPSYFKLPVQLGKKVLDGIADGSITDLFMVLRVPTTSPFPGISGQPPLIGLDGGVATNDVPIFGLSYTSSDGVTFTRSSSFNFRFSLVLSHP